MTSASTAILQWSFPPIIDEIELSYTNQSNENISQRFASEKQTYVTGLPHNSTTPIEVKLWVKGTSGAPQQINIKTKSLSEKYVPAASHRPENVPFYNDNDFKMSLSGYWATVIGPDNDPGWVTDPSRFSFFDWWNTWLMNNNNMPSCQDIEDITSLTIEGNIQTLIDIIAFVNLETLTINAGTNFSEGLAINRAVDLSILKCLKKLKTVIIGPKVPLTKEHFKQAGLGDLIIK